MGTRRNTQAPNRDGCFPEAMFMPQLPLASFNLGFFPPFLPRGASQGKFRHLQVSLKHIVFFLLSEVKRWWRSWFSWLVMLLAGECGSTRPRGHSGRGWMLRGAGAEFVTLKYKPVSFPHCATNAQLIPPRLENSWEEWNVAGSNHTSFAVIRQGEPSGKDGEGQAAQVEEWS